MNLYLMLCNPVRLFRACLAALELATAALAVATACKG